MYFFVCLSEKTIKTYRYLLFNHRILYCILISSTLKIMCMVKILAIQVACEREEGSKCLLLLRNPIQVHCILHGVHADNIGTTTGSW
jgi:hypothetical protein